MAGVKADPTVTPSPQPTLGMRFFMAGVGAVAGLMMGMMIWVYNALTGQHHEYLVTALTLMIIEGGIGFFVAPAKAAWIETILYFIMLGFLDN